MRWVAAICILLVSLAPSANAQMWEGGVYPLAHTTDGQLVSMTPMFPPPQTLGGISRFGVVVGGTRYTVDMKCPQQIARIFGQTEWQAFSVAAFAPAIGRVICNGAQFDPNTLVVPAVNAAPPAESVDVSQCFYATGERSDGGFVIVLTNQCSIRVHYNICTNISGRVARDYFPGSVAANSTSRHVVMMATEQSINWRYSFGTPQISAPNC